MSINTVGPGKDYETLQAWVTAVGGTTNEDHTANCYGGADLEPCSLTALDPGYKWVIQAAPGESPYVDSAMVAWPYRASAVRVAGDCEVWVDGLNNGLSGNLDYFVWIEWNIDVTLYLQNCNIRDCCTTYVKPQAADTCSVTCKNILTTGGPSSNAFSYGSSNLGTLYYTILSCTGVSDGSHTNGWVVYNAALVTLRDVIGVGTSSKDFVTSGSKDGDYCISEDNSLTTYGIKGANGTTGANPTDIFIDFAGGDYRPKRHGPAWNTGDPSGVVNIDILGNSRPQEGGYDRGAYELITIYNKLYLPISYNKKSNNTVNSKIEHLCNVAKSKNIHIGWGQDLINHYITSNDFVQTLNCVDKNNIEYIKIVSTTDNVFIDNVLKCILKNPICVSFNNELFTVDKISSEFVSTVISHLTTNIEPFTIITINKIIPIEYWEELTTYIGGTWVLDERGTTWILGGRNTTWVLDERGTIWTLTNR